MREELTQRQQEVLDFIQGCLGERGFPPTMREIGEHMGIRSTNGVNDHLKALERKGYLVRDRQKSRALRTVDRPQPPPTMELPVVGCVAAGAPILAQENVVDRLAVSPSMLGSTKGVLFALVVRGESMIEAGIFDGDYVFVRQTKRARQGEMVVVRIDSEATCKFFYRDGNTIRLEPANQQMKPILVQAKDARQVEIMGKVVGVYRKIR